MSDNGGLGYDAFVQYIERRLNTRECDYCGKLYTPRQMHNAKWCSVVCRDRGRAGQTATCAYCLTPFRVIRKRTRFCSLRCSSSMRTLGASCSVSYGHCRQCASPMVLRPKSRTLCSEECRLAAKRARMAISYVNTPERQYSCAVCHRLFARAGRHGSPRYCSTECASRSQPAKDRKRRGNQRRRAARLGVFTVMVDPVAIFVRDGWRCQLCGEPTAPSVAVPSPLAATLDHVVPLSRGGTHEPSNLQCAHFICNSRKGDRPIQSLSSWGTTDTFAPKCERYS